MAAITPATVNRVNVGSMNMLIANFTTVSDTDTWSSGINAIAGKWVDGNGNPATQTSAGVNSTFNATTGVFTFYPAENSLAATLYVLLP